ncbi:hypothetical protein P691DRAFT_766037 [Macrolepiota fuliginosa MF-IS2]|uniref:Uncharacterized protein n=1 Tax=Macrolepiota fuliginosa MF-IS2 TaxID=1400762 RepID=A0A9P6BVD0_9AGAR|nr:hypothetical protein P691DRAFT_766037 [Macrolepiota fuliginosa MF-IS2]
METRTTRSPPPHGDVPNTTTPPQSYPDNMGTPESFYDDPVMDAIIASLPDTFDIHPPGSVIAIQAEDSSNDSETRATRPPHRDIPDGIISPPPDPVDPGTPESFYDDPVMDAIIASLPDTFDIHPLGSIIVIRAEDSSDDLETQANGSPPGRCAPNDIASLQPFPGDPGTPDSFYDDPVINNIIASLPDTFEPLPPGGVIVIEDLSNNSSIGLEGESDLPVAVDNVSASNDESGEGLE